MKILVLYGSPKKENSDTLHITRAFLDGMNEAVHQEVHTIHVIDKHRILHWLFFLYEKRRNLHP